MRHLLIIDTRDTAVYDEYHIKDCKHITKGHDFIENIETAINNDRVTQESITDNFRRVVIIDDDNTDEYYKKLVDTLQEMKYFNKLFVVKLSSFYHKYPFLCVSTDNEHTEEALFSKTRFPSEIISDSLYLGNFTNIVSKKQLNALNIKTVIGLTPNRIDALDSHHSYYHFQYNEIEQPYIDFKEILDKIDEEVRKGNTVLLFCLTGMMSAAVTILYLERLKKYPKEISTAMVMSRRPEILSMPGWLYMQVQGYIDNNKLKIIK